MIFINIKWGRQQILLSPKAIIRTGVVVMLCLSFSIARSQQTPCELNGKNYTATYQECIDYYKKLDEQFKEVSLIEMGMTDAGLPLHLVLVNSKRNFSPNEWHKNKDVVILINNGIHPGEPDGIDASMMLVRDLAKRGELLPSNISLAFIPVYNIGGCLNRSEYNRVDQNGPEAFGSRGNSQNLDLNRDFIKCDSKEARAFTEIFQWINPEVFIDNHVSDGADYPYVMTLATSQHNKLGGEMGKYLHTVFEPALFQSMKDKHCPIIPYVNVWGRDAKLGWPQFFDSPRYSTGYASLFHTFGFTIESHMLKPYDLRVDATYQLMKSIFDFASENADSIITIREKSIQNSLAQTAFPIKWQLDDSRGTSIGFNGYAYKTKQSKVSGLPVKYYDRNDPYSESIQYKNYYLQTVEVEAPDAYIIPQGWWKVIELLQLNQVSMSRLLSDSIISVEAYTIIDCASSKQCYEGHHGNSGISTAKNKMDYAFRKGDYIIPLNQARKRFIVEVLEPMGEDSYFAWNYFDAILVQKEGYSDYAYEEIAARYLEEHPGLKEELNIKRLGDTAFAKSASMQLEFVYKHSPFYEKAHNLYPVFRVFNTAKFKQQKMSNPASGNGNKKDE